jgi:hypothetical protein
MNVYSEYITVLYKHTWDGPWHLQIHSDWPAINGNLAKAHKRWGTIRGAIAREGADARVSGYFYKAVVQCVVLYGCETWTHSGFSQSRHPQYRSSEGYPGSPDWGVVLPTHCNRTAIAREKAGIFSMEHYLRARQRSFVDQGSVWPITGLYRQATQQPDSCHSPLWWWTQAPLQVLEEIPGLGDAGGVLQ